MRPSTHGRLPTFLFIGADKTGSTWLFDLLRSHPQVFVPPAKDVYFFDRFYNKGLAWYASLFRSAPDGVAAVGELSHDYLYSAAAAERIAADLPGVRLIVFLRDPVERCFSEYLYLRRSGLTRAPFREAVERFPEIVEHSRYARHLRTYLRLFDADRIGIFFYEHLRADPERFARCVLEFVGVDWHAGLDVERNSRPAGVGRCALAARLARESAQVVRRLGAPGLVGRVKHSRVARLLYRAYDDGSRPRLSDTDRLHLERALAADVAALRELLPTDAPAWIGRSEKRAFA